jgi:hypothetical protein
MSFKNLANAARDTFIVSTPLSLSAITNLLSSSENISLSNFNANISRNLYSITIPTNIKSIGRYALANNHNLSNVVIKSNITTIQDYAFANCTILTAITLPESITSIGSNTFSGCTSLTDIYCLFRENEVSGSPWGAPDTTTVHYLAEEDYIRLLTEQAEEAATIASTNATEVDPYPELMEELKQQVS